MKRLFKRKSQVPPTPAAAPPAVQQQPEHEDITPSSSHQQDLSYTSSNSATLPSSLNNSYVLNHTPDTSLGEDDTILPKKKTDKTVAFVSPHASMLLDEQLAVESHAQEDAASTHVNMTLCIPHHSASHASASRLVPSSPVVNPYKTNTSTVNSLLPTPSLSRSPANTPWTASTAPFPSSGLHAEDFALSRSISPYSSNSSYDHHMSHPGTSHSMYPRSIDTRADSSGHLHMPVSWAAMTDQDLVGNLGGRERTRQEVLWEIVASEDRYVQDLVALVQNYIEPLLHPHMYQPSAPPEPPTSPVSQNSFDTDTNASSTDLPIARRFARSLSETQPSIDQTFRSTRSTPYNPEPSTSTTSLPKQSFLRHHLRTLGPAQHKKLHKPKTQIPLDVLQPPTLPDELRTVLETIHLHLLGRHESLSVKLKERWSAQYPLVRSLTDVWADQGWLIHDYSVYVLHLEKSLLQVEQSLKTWIGKGGEGEEKKLGRWIGHLEEKAGAKGESGLAIGLSKPFQRLLKYPLLFQNLLYHTDASTTEYESTQKLAVEIDRIVRSIESEKISEEERVKVRDLWARMDNVVDKALMAPRSERLLIEEVPLWQARPGPQSRSVSDATSSAPLSKPKKATRRLSDFMTTDSGKEKETKQPSVGSKRDIWLIYLTDVVIRCQRTGVTQHPIGAMTVSPGKKNSKDAKKRNLYKFIQVERWEMRDMVTSQKGGMVSMEEVAKYRHSVTSSNDDAEHIAEEEGGLGGRSRMSFIYTDDVPRPVNMDAVSASLSSPTAPRSFSDLANDPPYQPLATISNASNLTQTAARKRGPGVDKFSNRGRVSASDGYSSTSPPPRSTTPNSGRQVRNFERPTEAYLGKLRPTSPAPAPSSRNKTVVGGKKRAATPSLTGADRAPSPPTPNSGLANSRADSGMMLFQTYWKSSSTPSLATAPLH